MNFESVGSASVMRTAPVVFWDSGIGGLPYYRLFARRNPQRTALYLADRQNFPYGKKSKEELVPLLCTLAARIKAKINPPLIVLACNTASVSALAELRQAFPNQNFIGTVPAVRPAVLHSKTGITGILGTERTIADSYIDRLADETGRPHTLLKTAAPELVDFIENNFLTAPDSRKEALARRYIKPFAKQGADSIVLGCTHFLFLLDAFVKAGAACGITVYDSMEGICRRIETMLPPPPAAEPPPEPPLQPWMLVTGCAEPDEHWRCWASLLSMRAAAFDVWEEPV